MYFYINEKYSATNIIPTKTYEWNIGLIGSYKMPFSATTACIFVAEEKMAEGV